MTKAELKVHAERLMTDLKYYEGVLESYEKHPIEAIGNITPERQCERYFEIVERLRVTLEITQRLLDA